MSCPFCFFFSSRRRHTRWNCDWSSDVCSSDLKLMRETCYEVLEELGLHDDRIFKLAMALEKIALEDDYFVGRKLYPNVDFYSGIVQRALGIPVAMFTCIFSLARTVGWIAQWQE